MMTKIKSVISILVLAVACGIAAYYNRNELIAPALVSVWVGLFVVFAIWVFPEVKPKSQVNK